MFESLRRSLGRAGARFHFRASRDTVISFARAFRPDDRVLVLMPFFAPDDRAALAVLETIGVRFRQERMTIMTSGPQLTITRALPRAAVIAFTGDDLSALYLPRAGLLGPGMLTGDVVEDEVQRERNADVMQFVG